MLLCSQYTCAVLKTGVAFQHGLGFVHAFAEQIFVFAKWVLEKCISMQMNRGALAMHIKCVRGPVGSSRSVSLISREEIGRAHV